MTVIKDTYSSMQKYKKEYSDYKITFYSVNKIPFEGVIPFKYSNEIDIILTDVFIPKSKEVDSVACIVPYQKIFDYNTRISYFIFNDYLNTVYSIQDEQQALDFENHGKIKYWYAENILPKWHEGHKLASIRLSLPESRRMLTYTKEELEYLYELTLD